MSEKLLGDHIESLAKTLQLDKATKRLERITGKPCNCSQRKTNLNELHKRIRRRIIKN